MPAKHVLPSAFSPPALWGLYCAKPPLQLLSPTAPVSSSSLVMTPDVPPPLSLYVPPTLSPRRFLSPSNLTHFLLVTISARQIQRPSPPKRSQPVKATNAETQVLFDSSTQLERRAGSSCTTSIILFVSHLKVRRGAGKESANKANKRVTSGGDSKCNSYPA